MVEVRFGPGGSTRCRTAEVSWSLSHEAGHHRVPIHSRERCSASRGAARIASQGSREQTSCDILDFELRT